MSERKVIYVLICLSIITINFNLAAIAAVIPTISREFYLPDLVVSKIITYYMIPYGLAALVYAPLTRFLSYKTTLAGTLGIYSLVSLFCALTKSFAGLAAASAILGVAAAASVPLGLMIIGQFFEKPIRGRLIGTFFSCAFLASTTGILVTGFVHWRVLFFIPAFFGLMTTLAIIGLPNSSLARGHQSSVNYLHLLTNLRVRKVFLFIFILSFFYHGIHKWYGVYLSQEYQLDKFKISLFFMMTALSGIVGQTVGGLLTDKRGRMAACQWGTVLLALSTISLVGHYPLLILALILGLLSIGWTINHNGISTVLTDFSDNDRPMIASLNSSIRFISGGLGFYVSSFFVEKSFAMTFFIIGIAILFTSLFLKRVIP